MTTLEEFRDEVQVSLSDSTGATWANDTVEAWIVSAIRSYSSVWPREATQTISTTADQNEYDLPANYRSMLSVEYPTGETVPAYLERLSYLDDRFWLATCFYDVVQLGDATDAPQIWISADPTASQTITCLYRADHAFPTAGTDVLTVPDRDLPVLEQFVVWQAFRAQLANELKKPYRNMNLIKDMRESVKEAKQAYDQMLTATVEQSEGESRTVRWLVDGQGRVY